MFIHPVLIVAAADGNVDDTEWQTIALIGQALQMSVPELKAIIDKMASA